MSDQDSDGPGSNRKRSRRARSMPRAIFEMLQGSMATRKNGSGPQDDLDAEASATAGRRAGPKFEPSERLADSAAAQPSPGKPETETPLPYWQGRLDSGAQGQAEAKTREQMSKPDEESRREAERQMAGTPLPKRRSASSLRSRADSFLFIGFSLIGFISILILKQLGVVPELVSIIAVLAMVFYAVISYFRSDIRLRPDKLGDNIYYMGFVFTLASMASALRSLQSGTDISDLIGSFGVALFTTIAGIVGRVVLLQMRTEVEDVEEIVRNDLVQHAEALRGQLLASIESLEVFRLGVRDALDRRLEEAVQMHEKVINDHIARMSSVTKTALNRLNEAASANQQSFSEIYTATQGTVRSLQTSTEQFAKLEPLNFLLDEKFKGLTQAVTTLVNELQKMATTTQAASNANQQFSALAQTLAEVQRRLDSLALASAAPGTQGSQASQAYSFSGSAGPAPGAQASSIDFGANDAAGEVQPPAAPQLDPASPEVPAPNERGKPFGDWWRT